MPLALSLVVTGAIAGILAGLLGVGGGIVIVPVLYHSFSFLGVDESVRMHVAVGTSLATIIPTGIASAYSHYKRDSLDPALLKTWYLPVTAGVVAGTLIVGNVSGVTLTIVFGIVALLVAVNMAFRKEGVAFADSLPKAPFTQLMAAFIGLFSVMMGIGGGTLSVPILTAFGYPIRKAVGTASALGLVIAVPGALGALYYGLAVPARPLLSLGYINLVGFVLIVPATVLMAPVGARIAHGIAPRFLKRMFACFLFVTSLRMFYDLSG